MKKIILFTALICGYFIPAFSQINCPFKIDTTFRNLSIYNYQKPYSLGNISDFKDKLNGLLNDRNFLFNGLPNKNLNFSQDSFRTIGKTQTYDNMPCIKPQGFFPMRICKPDSTVRYSMRIEKLN